MKYEDVEILLDDTLVYKSDCFAYTGEREFTIKWKERIICFFGYDIGYFTVFAEDGNVLTNGSKAEAVKLKLSGNIETEISLLDNDVETSITEWSKSEKEYILENVENISSHYYKESKRFYDWDLKVFSYGNKLRRTVDEYISAALEPDGNVMANYRKEIIRLLEDLKKEYERL